MDREAYNQTRAMLAQQDWAIVTSRFDEHVFGSWFIVFRRGAATFQAIWDGRDRWLILQRDRHKWFHLWPKNWQDVWVGKNPADQSATNVISQADRVWRAS